MNIYRDNDIKFDKNSVITVGSFDGIHRGHRLVLDRLINIGKSNNLRSVLVTFDPHPQIVLKNKHKEPLKLLSTLEEKLKILESLGIENVWIINFTKEFANTDARDFIKNYLVDKAGVSKILLGYDHLFGKNREGNEDLLIEMGNEFNFSLEKIDPFELENAAVSSTKIRKALYESDIVSANKMLGRNYNIIGEVIKGKQRGRGIGYPTANILPDHKNKLIPSPGVYVVQSFIDENQYYGMCNLGVRPTFGDLNQELLEIHFFDLNQDLYGKRLNIEFLEFIREEQKFGVLEELVNQLNNDKEFSLKFLENFDN
jgi:riboflavin kinase/FMN adenylyltransferase